MLVVLIIAVALFNGGTSGRRHGSRSHKVKTKNNLVCEEDSLWIRCRAGEVIRITGVFWGRKDDPYCGGVSKPLCIKNLMSSTDYIENRCNKKKKCLIDATITTLGDPCLDGQRNTNYLQVAHQCLPDHNRRHRKGHGSRKNKEKQYTDCKPFKKSVKTSTAIPNSAMIIACPQGISIHVQFAKYGKFMRHCKKRGVDRIRNTGSQRRTFKEVYDRCEGKAHCSVPVDPVKFGDRRSIGDKSLQVAYTCVKHPLQLVDVKVNTTATLKCYRGKKIFVHFAYEKCAAFVDEQCQGYRRCTISGCRVEYACRKRKRFHRNGRGKYYTSKENSKSESDESESKSKESNSSSSDSREHSEYCKKCHNRRHCRDKCYKKKKRHSERRMPLPELPHANNSVLPRYYPVYVYQAPAPNLRTTTVPTLGARSDVPKTMWYKNSLGQWMTTTFPKVGGELDKKLRQKTSGNV